MSHVKEVLSEFLKLCALMWVFVFIGLLLGLGF